MIYILRVLPNILADMHPGLTLSYFVLKYELSIITKMFPSWQCHQFLCEIFFFNNFKSGDRKPAKGSELLNKNSHFYFLFFSVTKRISIWQESGSLRICLQWKWIKWKSLSPVQLCDPMGYSVHGIFQARILEWVTFPFSKGFSQSRDQTQVSRIAGRFFTSWATREVQEYWSGEPIPSPADLPYL